MATPLHVLMVEDSQSDAELAMIELRRGGFDPVYERVDTPAAMAAALDAGHWEVVIADYRLPGWSGLAALKMLQERQMDLPFIVVSGTIGEETAVEAMRAGAHDYVLKDNLTRLGPAVMRELRDVQVRRERRQALAALQDVAQRSAFLAEASRKLGGSLNYDETLELAARAPLPQAADWCVITALTEWPHKPRVLVCHVDPLLEARARQQLTQFPPEGRSEATAARVVKNGVREWTSAESALATGAGREADAELVRALGYASGLCLPLCAHGRNMGAMTLVRARDGGRFGDDDVAFAEELAARAAMAIDNASLYRQAREAIRARDEFLLVASHELNTPLATLTLQLNDVLPGLAPGQTGPGAAPLASVMAQGGMGTARRQVQRLSRLVNNLLDVSRITARRLELTLMEVDLVAATREVIEQLGPELVKAKCPISLQAPESADAVVGRWDPLRIAQIATNLISNALKYGAGKPIEVAIDCDSEKARLRVCDHGIGISASDVDRIFELFERSASARHFGGLGLGLYITRQLVEAHGGHIRVTSKPDDGSTFVVELPLLACTEARS
jgi:signal transduction histidine kinase/FixJ family two-component response regulator